MNYKAAFWMTWLLIGSAFGGYAIAASNRNATNLPGCIYNSSPPTLADGQVAPLQCDVNGKLKTTAS